MPYTIHHISQYTIPRKLRGEKMLMIQDCTATQAPMFIFPLYTPHPATSMQASSVRFKIT